MGELQILAEIAQLGGTVVVATVFSVLLFRLDKNRVRSQEASERRLENLLKENTEARRLDHDARNKETEALIRLCSTVDELNRQNGTRQKFCDDIREQNSMLNARLESNLERLEKTQQG